MNQGDRKKQVLILAGCYLPGIKGGGPIRTIANLVEVLGDEFEFSQLKYINI